MGQYPTDKDLETLMAEAEDLIRQIDAAFLEDIDEAQRAKVEEHAQRIREAQSQIQESDEQKKISDFGHGAKGMHEAIQEITKAMGELAKYLT